MEAMSVEAVGIYIDRLTDLRGLKVKAVAERAGVASGYVSRLISHNVGEPSASILWSLNEAVAGSWEDVGALLDPQASRSQAEALADAWYAKTTRVSAEEREKVRRRLLAAVDDLLSDEDRLRQELQS
jgi:transcriptional regulator with XRE-family HTH domain